MYSMKEVCQQVDMTYETLKFYCNEGLVPNVKRNKNNHRVFDERNVAWIERLQCLRKCGMSIKDMKQYLNYCLEGPSSIIPRKELLAKTKEELLKKQAEINECLQFIDDKQVYYDRLLSGEEKYKSNLIDVTQYVDN